MSNEIDTEKIRELNESLRELTGTVNVAEQAVEKIVTRLGFGDKLKKKVEERTEAEDKATTSIDKSTAAIDEERKKREETSKAQAEQFRKIFNIPGEKIQVIKNACIGVNQKTEINTNKKIKICLKIAKNL